MSAVPQVFTNVVCIDYEISVITFVVSNTSATKQYMVEIKAEEYVHADFVVGPMCTEKLEMIIAHADLEFFHADVQEIDNVAVVEAPKPKPPTRFARMRAMFKGKLKL